MNGSLLRGRLLVRIQSGPPQINPFTDRRVKPWEKPVNSSELACQGRITGRGND
jgi:hypothetical protein